MKQKRTKGKKRRGHGSEVIGILQSYKYKTVSDLYDQEQCVPQVYSTTLCNVKLNDIINCLDYKIDNSLYVDYFCICFFFFFFFFFFFPHNRKTSTTVSIVNRIEDWATRNGFKFSKSKSQCVHFCHQQKKKKTTKKTLNLRGFFYDEMHELRTLILLTQFD